MTLAPSRIRALCFDMDGTLSDTDDQYVSKLARWLSLVKFLIPGRDVRPVARRLVMSGESPGNVFLGMFDRLGADSALSRLGDIVYHLGLEKHPEPFVLVTGVHEMLAQLQSRFPMGIVTARSKRAAQRFLDQFELNSYFACMASEQTCRHTKPYPDPILWAAAQMGVAPEACLMIGDTTVDIRAGKAAGAQTAGVLCGFGEESELRRSGADVILQSTADLAEILKSGGG